MRAADGLLLGVLDDDPTGSQAVHDVQVVTVLDEDAYEAAFGRPAGTCFVLTNTRSLDEPAAVELNERAARGLIAVAGRRGARIQLVSRSDSTLRGHVMAEVAALQSVRREVLRPRLRRRAAGARLPGGRAGDRGRHALGPDRRGRLVPVGETEFARDAAFGYQRLGPAGLRGGEERRRGRARGRAQHQPHRHPARRARPGSATCWPGCGTGRGWSSTRPNTPTWRRWRYGVLAAERAGQLVPVPDRAVVRAGPARHGPEGRRCAGRASVARRASRRGHGLIVVGSHVGQTSRQVAALRARGGVTAVELDVPALVRGDDVIAPAARQVAAALGAIRRAALHQPHGRAGPGPRPAAWPSPARCRRRWPGSSARRWPPRPALGRGQGRDHLPRRGRPRPGHPPRRSHRPAVSRRDLGVPPARCGPAAIGLPVRGVRRQRRRRGDSGSGRGDPQRRGEGS